MSSTTKESLFTHTLSMGEGRRQKELERIAQDICGLSERFESMSDEELRDMTAHFRERLERGETLEELLPEAFAAVGGPPGVPSGCATSPCSSWGASSCIGA